MPAHGLLRQLKGRRRISLCSQVQTTSPSTGDGLSYLNISSMESGGGLGIMTRWACVNCSWCSLNPSNNIDVLHRRNLNVERFCVVRGEDRGEQRKGIQHF